MAYSLPARSPNLEVSGKRASSYGQQNYRIKGPPNKITNDASKNGYLLKAPRPNKESRTHQRASLGSSAISGFQEL
jgi:hypothetical protein